MDYLPVPVDAAKSIAESYRKDAVVILVWDAAHQRTHTTTYGVTAFDKENAAAVGELCTHAIGGDLGRKVVFEDFHQDYSPGRLREAMELLQKLYSRQAIATGMAQAVERWLRDNGGAVPRT